MDGDYIAKLPVGRRTRQGRVELYLLERNMKQEQGSCSKKGANEGSKRRKVSGGEKKDKFEVPVISLSDDSEEEFEFLGERDVGAGEFDTASRVFVGVSDEDEDDDGFEVVEEEEEKEVDMKEEEEEYSVHEEEEEEEEEDDDDDDGFEEVEVEVEAEEEEEEEDKMEGKEEEEEYSVHDDEDEDEDDHDFVATAVSESDSEDVESYVADEDDDNYVGEKETNQIRVEGSDDELEVISISDDESDDEDLSTTAKSKAVQLKKKNEETGSNKETSPRRKSSKSKSTGSNKDTGAERNTDQEPEPEPESKSAKKKLGRRALDELEVQKILAASILEEEEGSFPCEDEKEEIPEPPAEWKLPLKFFFGEPERPPSPEKSESEKHVEDMWSEMDLSMSQIYANQSQMDKDDPDGAAKLDSASRCSRGNHYFILDEEIGTICKYCYKIGVEIRYIVPQFSKNPFGGKERRTYARMANEAGDDIDCEDLNFESQSGADPTVDFSGTVWSVIPGIRRGMHPHQIEGFEFLWKNIAGGIRLDDLAGNASSSQGSGCIISHAPGTGKSRLTIAFLEAYMKLYPSCKPVIIAPACMLQTWEAEFKKWKVEVPFHNLNNNKITGKENKEALKLIRGQDTTSIRLTKLYSWKKNNGVLALSYRLFEGLTGGGDKKNVWKALVDLPGLLILDEGHTARNSNSLIWKALSRMQTGKKIILSGTPFQNNFEELFNVLCLVRPEFAEEFFSGSYKGKYNAREYWDSITSGIGKCDNQNMESKRVEQVRDMIAPFMHVHKGNILQAKLPGLRDAVIILEPTGVQKQLLDRIDGNMIHQNFEMEHAVSVACVHPYLLCTKARDPSQRRKLGKTSLIDFDMSKLESLQSDPDAGVKTKFLMELVQLSNLVGEKVLVFSQYVEPLNLISKQLEDRFSWSQRKEILIMHGRCPQDQRQAMLKHFNDPWSSSKVMLASTKACSEGISLVGASRVVLLDVVWNPSVGKQAISRAYRLGQEKVVYIYHLLASALEEAKYLRQAQKQRWSEMVIYSADEPDGSKKHLRELADDKKDRLLEEMVEGDKLKDIFKNIILQPKDRNLVEAFSDE